jgi:hypothetical protein
VNGGRNYDGPKVNTAALLLDKARTRNFTICGNTFLKAIRRETKMIIKSIKVPQRLHVKLFLTITIVSSIVRFDKKLITKFPIKKRKLDTAGIKVEDKVQNEQDV